MTLPRKVEKYDREGVLSLLREAFESPLEAELVSRLWDTDAIIAERLIDDGAILSYAAVSEVTVGFLGDDRRIGEALGLAPVATVSIRRCEGLAEAVVNATLAAAFAAYPYRLMFVLGDASYYRRFGFVPAATLGYQWEGGNVGDAFQVLRNGSLAAPFAGSAPDSGSRSHATVFYNDAFSIFGEEC